MAKSKLAVAESGAEQSVVEPEAGIDSQSAVKIPAAPECGEAPAPVLTDEEAAILAHEGEAALHDIGDDGLEPPTPFDIHAPDNVIVPFDKIRETAREAEQTAPLEKQEAEKSDKALNKRGRRGKSVQQEAQEAKTEDTRKEPEEQRSGAEPKKERKPRIAKQKPAAEKEAPAKAEAPAPEPEKPQEPKEAPRKGEQEQIVFGEKGDGGHRPLSYAFG